MKWLRYFVLLLPLILSFEFSFANSCTQSEYCNAATVGFVFPNGDMCKQGFSAGGGLSDNAYDACVSAGFKSSSDWGGEIPPHWRLIEGGGDVDTYCWKLCEEDNPSSSCWELHKNVFSYYFVVPSGSNISSCSLPEDDPCGNGKDPATCDMEDPPPADPDDPCGNGKDPATCDMDEDPDPDPEPPKYDDDYKPEDPPCQIMVNGKCYNANGMPYDPDNPSDPNNPNNPNYDGGKNKICSNGYCKCFKKNENGILKEVPCNDSKFYDESCSDPYDPETCSSNWQEDMFPEMEDMPDYNPNSQYDDASYNFDGLDTSTDLPDAKDIKDKSQEVDLSSWGVNDYFNSSGQCPAPSTVSLGMFGSFEVSYEYFCRIASILRTVVIAFAWLTGLLIIAKINK